jgi:hypothetical protein
MKKPKERCHTHLELDDMTKSLHVVNLTCLPQTLRSMFKHNWILYTSKLSIFINEIIINIISINKTKFEDELKER